MKKATALLTAIMLAGGGTALCDVNVGPGANELASVQEFDSAGSVSAAGSQSVGVGVGNFSQTFEASDRVPYLPNSLGAPVISPTLFNLIGGTAQTHGARILANNLFSPDHYDHATGSSGGTEIVFNSADVPERKRNENPKVLFSFDGRARGELVGSLTIESKKGKARKVDLATLIHDATHYVANVRQLKNHNVTLLSSKEAISYGMGVDSKSGGFSLSPLISGIIDGPESIIAGMASGFSRTGGVTVPASIIGCTFLVLIESDNARDINILSNYNPQGAGDEAHNGNGRKKYEATKQ